MGDRSKIEWCDATWNPVTGCTKVSPGCAHCYAESVWPRMQHLPGYEGRSFSDVRCHPERLDQPHRWRRPRRIFVNSMSDLFHPDVPDDLLMHVCRTMMENPRHTFLVLTKRPERMRDFCHRLRWNNRGSGLLWLTEAPENRDGWRPFGGAGCSPMANVWLGVSVENQATADERIPILLGTPAALRFVSCEPLLGPVNLLEIDKNEDHEYFSLLVDDGQPRIHWVIVGGESGPQARPMHPDWVRAIRDDCKTAQVPFFFKQWGGEWAEYHRDMMMPGEVVGLRPSGEMSNAHTDVTYIKRIGKRRAGNHLDGVQHMETPEGSK